MHWIPICIVRFKTHQILFIYLIKFDLFSIPLEWEGNHQTDKTEESSGSQPIEDLHSAKEFLFKI